MTPADSRALRARALELDRTDPLAGARSLFQFVAPEPIYLDGNSLGRLPLRSIERARRVLEEEWGRGLVRSWSQWMPLSTHVGDQLGSALLGAAPGQVAVADSTTVNLYKLAAAALDQRPGRSRIVSDRHNFPTDRYLLEGLAAARGLQLQLVDFDELEGPDPDSVAVVLGPDVALLSLSHVDYRSGAIADMAGITAVAHAAGALTLWDLCHSVGAVPVELDRSGADLAAGCTYKYLNAGPGAPAFLYIRRDLQERLLPPIWGWFGQTDQFAMGPEFQPVPGVARFLSGSPSVLGLALVEEGVQLLAEIGIRRIREKSVALTQFLAELAETQLAPLGFQLASPRDPERRGSHVTLQHPLAERVCQNLLERGAVVADHRRPDRLRLGCAAPTTTFLDLWDAVQEIEASARGVGAALSSVG